MNKKLFLKDTHDVYVFVIEHCDVTDVVIGSDKVKGTYLNVGDHAEAVGAKLEERDSNVRVHAVEAGKVFLKREG